jgi:hypothetical protein
LKITIYTIGFSGKNQDVFFDILTSADIKNLIDIRLWRVARFVPSATGCRTPGDTLSWRRNRAFMT